MAISTQVFCNFAIHCQCFLPFRRRKCSAALQIIAIVFFPSGDASVLLLCNSLPLFSSLQATQVFCSFVIHCHYFLPFKRRKCSAALSFIAFVFFLQATQVFCRHTKNLIQCWPNIICGVGTRVL